MNDKALVPAESVSLEPITLNPISLREAKSWEDFISLWMVSREIEVRNLWFRGDIANQVVTVYGEGSLKKFCEEVHEELRTVITHRRVSRAFPPETRIPNLSWSHHAVASFTDSSKGSMGIFSGEERFKWIERASDENWSIPRLASEIKAVRGTATASKDYFLYYMDYLDKIQNIFTHIDKSKLEDVQIDKLTDRVEEMSKAVVNFLST